MHLQKGELRHCTKGGVQEHNKRQFRHCTKGELCRGAILCIAPRGVKALYHRRKFRHCTGGGGGSGTTEFQDGILCIVPRGKFMQRSKGLYQRWKFRHCTKGGVQAIFQDGILCTARIV
jgi:hypothetical protein